MQYLIRDGILCPCTQSEKIGQALIHMIQPKEVMELQADMSPYGPIIEKVLSNHALRFENHDSMDVLCVHIHSDCNQDHRDAIHICFYEQHLWIISEQIQLLDQQMQKLLTYDQKNWTLTKVLYHFIDQFLEEEGHRLDQIQKEILALEDIVITDHGNEHTVRKIIHLRKRLLRQERAYEQAQDALERLVLNENGLFPNEELRSYQLLLAHCERLLGRVSSLQSYVTEIREAYQAEVDINLNVTMRIFTVITAVFLPLTLIAGWYGMNLKMPEYELEYGYPMVIGISILITICLLVYFKKHRWF